MTAPDEIFQGFRARGTLRNKSPTNPRNSKEA
jgi:hypothetical protein